MLRDYSETVATREDIVAAYKFILRREPDEEGLSGYTTMAREGHLTLDRLVHEFYTSDEYRARMATHIRHIEIRRCFLEVYGRNPTQQEVECVEDVANRIRAKGHRGLLRATIAAFSRHSHPTPISVRFTEEDLVEAAVAGSTNKLTLDTADLSTSDGIIHGHTYEPHLGRVIPLFLKSGMTAVDVGANVGFHTQTFASLVGPSGKVFAFEPNTENCRMLLLTKSRCRLENTEIIPIALSDRTGFALFSPAIGSNGAFLANTIDTVLHPNCMVIPTVRLDDIIHPERLDFMKIDVEGAEYLVIQGGWSLIEKHRPVIFSEFSRDMAFRTSRVEGPDYLAAMMQRSYRVYTLGLSGPVMQVTDCNAFFATWGDYFRIEDFAFVPIEKDPGIDAIRQGAVDH